MFLLDGFPLPPPDPGYTPGPLEAFFDFMLAYLLLVMIVLWLLPRRWTQIAFGKLPKDLKPDR